MAGHRRDRGNRWLSTCVGVTIALSVYAFVTGPGWTRPLFFLMLGLTAILAAGELRRTGWSTADEAAMQLLIDTGRMPNGATAVTTQCPEGSVIAVWSGPSELPPGRYFVDLDGAVYSLSSSCGSAQRFVELSPDTAAREPFAIRADGAR